MKKQITKVLLAMILLASGFMSNANERVREISLKSADSKSVVLQINNVTMGSEVTLWGENGELLFKDRISQTTYSKVFNLNQLERGALTLEVESQESLEVMPISVTEERAEFNQKEERIYAKPVVRIENDLMKIFLRENHEAFDMKITDHLGQSVLKEHIGEGKTGLKRYDVSKLSKGQYNIQFTADGRSFYHTIIIE